MALVEDRFETVAITWSQPEAAVMLSMFAFYGIPAFALGKGHASVNPTWMVGLQGIHVRVHAEALDDARGLLSEVAARPAAVRPYLWGSPAAYPLILAIAFTMAVVGYSYLDEPDSPVILAVWPLSLLMTAPPPTRTPATFLLGKRAARDG